MGGGEVDEGRGMESAGGGGVAIGGRCHLGQVFLVLFVCLFRDSTDLITQDF